MHHSNAELARVKIQISLARRELESLWNARGLTDADVLAAGEKLDALCNEYHRASNNIEKRKVP